MGFIHHSNISFSREELIKRRKDNWRERLTEQIHRSLAGEALNAAIAMTAQGAPQSKYRAGKEALTNLGEFDRLAVWQAVFPRLWREVELTWSNLPPSVIHQRDGGEGGTGSRYRFEPDANMKFMRLHEWVRKLVLISAPFPELDLAGLLAITESFCSGLHWPHDHDAPAYAAVAVLNEGGQMATPVWEVLRQIVAGSHHTGLIGRHVRTSLLCCERPEAWELLDGPLLNAGLDDGFRRELVRDHIGIHPAAWVHFLQTIRDHKLLRYDSIRESVESALGLSDYSGWRFTDRAQKVRLFEKIVCLHESEEARTAALTNESAINAYFALFAMGTKDAAAAIMAADKLLETKHEAAEISAAWFLVEAEGTQARAVLRRAVGPERLLASAIAARYAPSLFSPCPDAFSRLERLIQQFDSESTLAIKMPLPWPDIRADRDAFCCWLVRALPDGQEERIVPWIDRMGSEARNLMVTSLNRMQQTPQMRLVLARMMRDPSLDVAEHAAKAIWSQPLSRSEIQVAENILELKSAKRRDIIFRLLMKQSRPVICESTERLLNSTNATQRLAGLNLIRRLGEKQESREIARKLYKSWERPDLLSKDEITQVEIIDADFDDSNPQEPGSAHWRLANAFGLVNPANLPKFKQPNPPYDVLLHSPVTVSLLEQMAQLYRDRSHLRFDKKHWNGETEEVVLGEAGFPYFPHQKTFDEARGEFPLIADWEDWWQSRANELRDSDGFELERLSILIDRLRYEGPPQALKVLYGIDSLPAVGIRDYFLSNMVTWLQHKFRNPNWRTYWVTMAEQVHLLESQLPESAKFFSNGWISRGEAAAFPYIRSNESLDFKPELAMRMWQLLCLRKPDRDLGFHTLLIAFENSIATKEEFIWGLIGHSDSAIESLHQHDHPWVGQIQVLTNFAWRDRVSLETRKTINDCCHRLVECESRRGEAPTDATFILNTVGRFYGTHQFIKILHALGSNRLQRNADSKDGSKSAVFTHLISVCHPAASDNIDQCSRLLKEARVDRDRLIEVAVLAPQWADLVSRCLGIDSLKVAIGWIHAHTKTSDWRWKAKSQEVWAGELGRLTPLKAEQLMEGAVDVEWFHRARNAVGDEIWARLHAAAKFACSAAGHTRARLFSDALLGKVASKELMAHMRKKRHQDSARALGLVPLPISALKQKEELLHRYKALCEFKTMAWKAKPQRRGSELIAWQTGIDNLARNAGYLDPQRFRWNMETLSVAELKSNSLRVTIKDAEAWLEVTPWGKVEISSARLGRPLKDIPVDLRKHPAIQELRTKQEEFREQAARLRPELEEMMIDQAMLPALEWKAFLGHPLIEPLLRRLVLATSSGPMGFPSRQGLTSPQGKIMAWPKSPLFLAHSHDLMSSRNWPAWQEYCVKHEIVQPFKQIFREYYCPVSGEKESIKRFSRHRIKTNQTLALLGKRGWLFNPEEGMHRVFHRHGIIVWLQFEEYFYQPRDQEEATISELRFQDMEGGRWINAPEVHPVLFSEVLRDVDLAVSVGHASGFDPEATQSSIEIRAALVKLISDLLKRNNVTIEGNRALIKGSRAIYRVHLGSGIVHQADRKMLRIYGDPALTRGRLFLPFADDDPKMAEILSKVLWLSEDQKIRDPGFLSQLA